MTRLTHSELLQLKRWNTPTIYNGWEQVTAGDIARDAFNIEETRDFMPQMGPMVGYAITVVIEPSQKSHRTSKPNAWHDYRDYVAPNQAKDCSRSRPRQAASLGIVLGEVNSTSTQPSDVSARLSMAPFATSTR